MNNMHYAIPCAEAKNKYGANSTALPGTRCLGVLPSGMHNSNATSPLVTTSAANACEVLAVHPMDQASMAFTTKISALASPFTIASIKMRMAIRLLIEWMVGQIKWGKRLPTLIPVQHFRTSCLIMVLVRQAQETRLLLTYWIQMLRAIRHSMTRHGSKRH